jgi:hypothetical protein
MNLEGPLLVPTERGLTAVIDGIHLYPPEDPIGYARKRVRSAQIAPRSLVFIPSVGLGHGLSDLLDRLPEGSAVLCVEADQRIMALASSCALPEDPRLTVIRTENAMAVALALSRMGAARFRRVVELPLSAGYRLNPGLYASFADLLVSEIRTYWQNKLTLISMGGLWVRNLFENLPLLLSGSDFRSKRTSLPIVVAGAGPSLETAIKFLKTERRSFFLAAVDTVLPVLAAESIRPDLVVVLEAQAANLADFLPSLDPSLPLACDLASSPLPVRLFRRNLCFFSSSFAPVALLDRLAAAGLRPAPFPPLGSVGAAAAYAAFQLTHRDVFLVGLDFSYPDGRTHARGTPAHIAMLAHACRIRPAGHAAYVSLAARAITREKDKNGKPVLTDIVMKSYRDGLARIIERDAYERTWDLGVTGLPLGARFIGMEEASEKLESAHKVDGEPIAEAGHFGRPAIEAFLDGEARLLSSAKSAIRSLLSSKSAHRAPPEAQDALKAIDYTFVHFPDEPDIEAPTRSFLARALIAADYYSTRLARIRQRTTG